MLHSEKDRKRIQGDGDMMSQDEHTTKAKETQNVSINKKSKQEEKTLPRIVLALSYVLKLKKMSLRSLSLKTGISYQALWTMSKNKTNALRFDNLSKIIQVLKCRIEDLFFIEQEKEGYVLLFLPNRKTALKKEIQEMKDKNIDKGIMKEREEELKKIEKQIEYEMARAEAFSQEEILGKNKKTNL